jgi:23S rRNA (uridine2552-2'-O)-methyltransferase
MAKRRQDYLSKKAKKEGYPARSIYKLEELDKRYKLFKPGMQVLDLGCSPGSWLLYASQKIGSNGEVIGIDIQRPTISLPKNAKFLNIDVFSLEPAMILEISPKFHLVLSDLAPNTSGIQIKDCYLSLQLFERAVEICSKVLLVEGNFIGKLFIGEGFHQAQILSKNVFKRVKITKPKATRKQSREIYVIGFGLK